MKLFIGILITLAVIILIIILAINILFRKMDKSDPEYIEKFKSIPDSLKVCNFGSSHGLYNFNYEDVQRNGYECFNFGLISQYISYDYRLIQQYGNHIGKGTIVFIPISYYHFIGKGEEFDSDYETKNKRYYLILPSELIKDYDIRTNICVKYFPAFGVDKSTLKNTLTGKDKTSEDNDSEWMKVASDIDVLEDAKAACKRHVGRKRRDDNGNLILNQEEIDALYELIAYCKAKSAVPILVTTPYLSEYTDEIKISDPDFYDKFYSIIDAIIESTEIKYYDYAFDERFSHSYELFSNADHLNKEGARQFTNILIEEAAGRYNETE